MLKIKLGWGQQPDKGSAENKTIDDEFHSRIKKYQLRQRCKNALRDNTDYVLRLRDFCENNQHNVLLLTKVAGYHSYLIKTGCNNLEAAKLVLEEYQH